MLNKIDETDVIVMKKEKKIICISLAVLITLLIVLVCYVPVRYGISVVEKPIVSEWRIGPFKIWSSEKMVVDHYEIKTQTLYQMFIGECDTIIPPHSR